MEQTGIGKEVRVIIDDAHAEKINDIIARAEGKATARTCTYDDVRRLAERAEKKLRLGGASGNALVISKAHLDGTLARYHRSVSCNSYGSFHAESTAIDIVHNGDGWRFAGARRESYSTSNTTDVEVYSLMLAPEAGEDVRANAMSKYSRC